MKINSPADDKITVDLTKQDMAELDITYEEMDYSTIETRRVIWTLLDEAGKALGKELDPTRKMIIEAVPKSEGGCQLNFTILDCSKKAYPHKQILKKQSDCLICEFCSFDALCNASERFRLNACSSLYSLGGKYRLVLSGFDDAREIKQFFSEFSDFIGSGRMCYEHTAEHWKNIIPENAISTISGS